MGEEKWKDHFEKLLDGSESMREWERGQAQDDKEEKHERQQEELLAAIKSLKKEKASWKDGI